MRTEPYEVFIAFTKNSNVHELAATFDAWDMPGYEPVGIQVQAHQFDIQRRVAAESQAKSDYIIADIGTKPSDELGVYYCTKGQLKVEEVKPRECASPSSSE